MRLAAALVVLSVASLAHAQPASRAEKLKVAVMDLKPTGVAPEVAASLTGIVANELERLQVFSVISPDEIRAMVTREAQQQALGCDADSTCLADIGGALGTRYLASGAIGKVGDTYTMTLSMTDTEKAKVVGRFSESAKEQSKLVDLAKRASGTVVRDILAERQATLLVTCAEPGATVKIDDAIVGVTPLPRRPIAWGVHTIVVEKQGFIASMEDFTVLSNNLVERNVTLVPSPDFLDSYESGARKFRIGAWITTVAAAASLGAAGYFQARHISAADEFDAANKVYSLERTDANYKPVEAAYNDAKGAIRNAWITGGLGLAFAAGATFFWVAGEDPDRYARYRGVATIDAGKDDGSRLAVRLFDGPGLFSASIELP